MLLLTRISSFLCPFQKVFTATWVEREAHLAEGILSGREQVHLSCVQPLQPDLRPKTEQVLTSHGHQVREIVTTLSTPCKAPTQYSRPGDTEVTGSGENLEFEQTHRCGRAGPGGATRWAAFHC